jgi:regulator of cell morphogenesis and NO signaling
MKFVDPGATLGELVLAHPAAATLFERLGLDYCCGGRRTLEQACAQRGLDADTVGVLVASLDQEPAAPAHDVARSSIADLCEHIVARHHDPLRDELARIGERLDTVVRVHGREHPELADLQRLFAGMRGELEVHMRVEEHALFPACRALDERDDASGFDEGVVVLLEDEHDATGDALCALRELSGGYDAARALCGTHRALLESLARLELEMHQHIHEENNLLFPRVRERIAARSSS